MKVKKLLQDLEGVDPEMEVILTDGNKTSPLSAVSLDLRYQAENTWSGDLINPEDLEESDPDGTQSVEVVTLHTTY